MGGVRKIGRGVEIVAVLVVFLRLSDRGENCRLDFVGILAGAARC
jgi:hypothetical protein